MTVIVANDTPPAIRGLLKRWFIEPKPNVFVGTVNARTRDKVMDYIRRNAGEGCGMLVISRDASSQGFSIRQFGPTARRLAELCGLALVAEVWQEETSSGSSESDEC